MRAPVPPGPSRPSSRPDKAVAPAVRSPRCKLWDFRPLVARLSDRGGRRSGDRQVGELHGGWARHGREASRGSVAAQRAWSARLALDLLPANNGPRVEVLRGSVVISPDGDHDQRTVQRELTYRVGRAGRRNGLWAYRSVNLIAGDDLLIPHLAVLRLSGRGRQAMPVETAVLLGEISSSTAGGCGLIDRPREYAAAGVPFFLRVDPAQPGPGDRPLRARRGRVPAGLRRCGRHSLRHATALRVLGGPRRSPGRGGSGGGPGRRGLRLPAGAQ
ncbi:Uma2 family endonuclease [Micromonospora psammae]|uniref:Uma2 family endonuclease n=1 Tax=Micromonospora sp. CPCC 205556 TaxID=3122398 RepID=UPI003FA58251